MLQFRAEVPVNVTPEEVWAYFTDLSKWPAWSPICRECTLRDGVELGLGSVLQMRLRFFGMTFTGEVTVVEFEPPHKITWRSVRPRAKIEHTYLFLPHKHGTLLVNEETLTDVARWLRWPMWLWLRGMNLSRSSLNGLKRELECASSLTATECHDVDRHAST